MPTLSRITVYPIKSLDGIEVSSARVLPSGALEHDRRYTLADEDGKLINTRRVPKLTRLRATYDESLLQVTVHLDGQSASFSLREEQVELARWCGSVLGVECQLLENSSTGFPDDLECPGPTLVSSGSLEEVAGWFPELEVGETRRRFRTNLEVAIAEPFWEDQLMGAANPTRQFRIGATQWRAEKICQRCAVPTLDSYTGKPIEGFAKQFVSRREQSLPASSPREKFDHFYRMTLNTQLDSLNGAEKIRVGDEVEPLGGHAS